MIHEIGVELMAQLKAQGCPFPVVDGPERTDPSTWSNERIVIVRDEGGDSFGPPPSQHVNPKMRMVRTIGVKATIYAQSPDPNATYFEHARRAEHALDLVLCALGYVAAIRKNVFTPTGGKFVQPDDLKTSEAPAGAVYELSFKFSRGVFDVTWTGAAQPTAVLTTGHITSTTKASMTNGPTLDEVGCGT